MFDPNAVDTRLATMHDADDLLEIKNEEAVRAFSIVSKDLIKRENHLKWLAAKIEDPNTLLYAIIYGNRVIGDVRFDLGETIEVSIRIAKDYRDMGIGSRIIKIASNRIQELHYGKTLTAKIVEGNERSMKVFTKNGFKVISHADGISYLSRPARPLVSAILVNYKRPEEMKAVVADLSRYWFIDEILIHDNSAGRNVMCYGRYLSLPRAKNEAIYVQDDDCIIENLAELYGVFDGTKLVNGMKPERAGAYQGRDSMMGWGAFFMRSWASVLGRYIDKYGEDEVLIRESDRIFTTLLEVPRMTLPAYVRDFPSAMAPFALSLQPEHEQMKRIALERARELAGVTV